MTDEEALSYLLDWLRRRVVQWPTGNWGKLEPYGFDIYSDLIRQKLRLEPIRPNERNIIEEKLPFLNAIWGLCLRGILRPGAVVFHAGSTPGGDFALTTYGLHWLQTTDPDEATPMEYGRFSELLGRHGQRFGAAYHARSQEAIRCYEAHTYYACCAMCGAAAESILLALASTKMGGQAALHVYLRARGRSNIRNELVGKVRTDLQSRFDNYLELMSYWRDEAAHGISRAIGEEESFTSLLLLLRFARLADNEWSTLTNSSVPITT